MPRDLKEPLGCRFSSFKKTLLLQLSVSAHHIFPFRPYQRAARDSGADSISGVSRHGFGDCDCLVGDIAFLVSVIFVHYGLDADQKKQSRRKLLRRGLLYFINQDFWYWESTKRRRILGETSPGVTPVRGLPQRKQQYWLRVWSKFLKITRSCLPSQPRKGEHGEEKLIVERNTPENSLSDTEYCLENRACQGQKKCHLSLTPSVRVHDVVIFPSIRSCPGVNRVRESASP